MGRVALLAVMAGCGGAEPERPPPITHGVHLAPLLDADTWGELPTSPIGRPVWLGDSIVAVADDLSQSVYLLHVDGRVTTWGRLGNGPGEFRSIVGLDAHAGSLWVLDGSSGRLTVFNLTGGVDAHFRLGLRMTSLVDVDGESVWVIAAMGGGSSLVRFRIPDLRASAIRLGDVHSDLGIGNDGVPLLPALYSATASRGRVIIAEVHRYRLIGLPRRPRDGPGEVPNLRPLPRSDDDARAWQELLRQTGVADRIRPESVEAMVRAMARQPRAHLRLNSLATDRDGNIWVVRRDTARAVADVFDANLAHRLTLPLPAGARSLGFKGDTVVALSAAADGRVGLHAFRYERR